jgi:hypothetical protein
VSDKSDYEEAMAKFKRPDRAAQGKPPWMIFGPDDDFHPDPDLVEALHQPDEDAPDRPNVKPSTSPPQQ